VERHCIARLHELVRREHCVPVRHRGAALQGTRGIHPDVVTHGARREDTARSPDVGAHPVQIPSVRCSPPTRCALVMLG